MEHLLDEIVGHVVADAGGRPCFVEQPGGCVPEQGLYLLLLSRQLILIGHEAQTIRP